MEFDELSQNVIGCAIDVHRNLGSGLLESTYRQCLACELSHARIPFQSCRCPFVTKISCSIAAIGSICSYAAISSSKSKASKRFFQSIRHKFLHTCDSPRYRLVCLLISTPQSCKTASNAWFCKASCSSCLRGG
jgi:hypothetical protein